jgi:hypothetical protein
MHGAERAFVALRLGDRVHARGEIDLSAAQRAQRTGRDVELPEPAGYRGARSREQRAAAAHIVDLHVSGERGLELRHGARDGVDEHEARAAVGDDGDDVAVVERRVPA